MTNGRLRGYNLNSHPHSSSSGVRITLKSHLARFTRSPNRSARFHFTRRHRLCRTQDTSHAPSTRKVHSSSELIPKNRRTIDSVFTRTVRFERKKKRKYYLYFRPFDLYDENASRLYLFISFLTIATRSFREIK